MFNKFTNMRQVNIGIDDFFEGLPKSTSTMKSDENISIEFSDLSRMISEAVVVLDFQKRKIQYVSSNYLFLCGFTPEKVKEEGYDFFKLILHPEDLLLWRDIHIAILKSLYNNQLPVKNIIFFGCTLRIRNFLSYKDKNPDYIMVYLKIKPKFLNGIPLYGICLVSISVVPKSGNLCVFYNNNNYSRYNVNAKMWKLHPLTPLSRKELQILIWSHAGLTNVEMAAKLCQSVKVIEKTKTSLFEKLIFYDEFNLNSFSKKLQFALNRCLIYQSPVNE